MSRAVNTPLIVLRIISLFVGVCFVLVSLTWGESHLDVSSMSPTRSSMLLAGIILLLLTIVLHRRPELVLLTALSSLVSYVLAIAVLSSDTWQNFLTSGHGVFTFGQIGIFQEDSLLGFDHIPNSSGRERSSRFDVTYTIDDRRCRTTHTPTSPKGTVLFLGGSFTFGYGVEDDENYPAVIGAEYWTDYKIRNRSVNAWGTGQVYLALKQELALEETPRAVCYGWIEHHVNRNYLRSTWLDVLGYRKNTHFEIEGDGLVYNGRVGREHGIETSQLLREQEEVITLRLVKEMARLCKSRGIPFFVIRLPEANPIGVHLFDCSSEETPIRVVNATRLKGPFYVGDGHPTADLHREIARFVANSEISNCLGYGHDG